MAKPAFGDPDRLDALDAEVLGIPPQSVESHEHWVKKQEPNAPLLADEGVVDLERAVTSLR